MDPATLAVLIRTSGEVAALLIGLLKDAGREPEADEIARILTRSDSTWQRILDRAEDTSRPPTPGPAPMPAGDLDGSADALLARLRAEGRHADAEVIARILRG